MCFVEDACVNAEWFPLEVQKSSKKFIYNLLFYLCELFILFVGMTCSDGSSG